jgi:hypothetical protein
MKGSYSLKLETAIQRYELKINRSITLINGNSSSGKSEFVDLLATTIGELENDGRSTADFETTFDDVYVVDRNSNFDSVETYLTGMFGNLLVVADGDTCVFKDMKRLINLIEATGFYFLLITRDIEYFNGVPHSICELKTERIGSKKFLMKLSSVV